MTKSDEVPKFLKIMKETWFLVLFVGGVIVAWTTLNMRVNAMVQKIAQYPSQDWFELKFSNLDNSVSDISIKLDEHINQR